MPPVENTLPTDSGDFGIPTPPPIPPGCSEELRYQLEFQQWSTKTVVGQLQSNQAAHKRNHEELKTELSKLHTKVDEKVGPKQDEPLLKSLFSGVIQNKILQQAVATAIAGLIASGAAYMAFKLTGTPTTPTPVDVVPLIEDITDQP